MIPDRIKKVNDLIAGGISESQLALKFKFEKNISEKRSIELARGAFIGYAMMIEEERIKEEEPEMVSYLTKKLAFTCLLNYKEKFILR